MSDASKTTPSSPELVQLAAETGSYAFYCWRNIMITCWSKRATGPAVQRLTVFREALDRDHPEGLSVIYLIRDKAGLPTVEARAGVRELMARFSHRRACLALVVQGEGFWSSAMQATITGVRILVPKSFHMRVFSRVEDVVDWLPKLHKEHTGVSVVPHQLLNVLKQLMATL
jgi:hypothetical protein